MIEEIIARAPRTWAFKVPSERLQKLTRFSELGELLAFRTGQQPSYGYDKAQWESWDELSAHVRQLRKTKTNDLTLAVADLFPHVYHPSILWLALARCSCFWGADSGL